MPVTKKVCKVTGISFSVTGNFMPNTDNVVHPMLYGVEVSYLLNVTRTLLSNKRYDLVAEEVTRFLFIKSLWEVEIDSVYLSPIVGGLEPEEVRTELQLSIDLHDAIPKNRFKLNKVKDRPWKYIKDVLKSYGQVYIPKGRDLEERLARHTDDILAGRVILARDLLHGDIIAKVELLGLLRTMPIDYLREIGIKNKDKELLKLLIAFEKIIKETRRI